MHQIQRFYEQLKEEGIIFSFSGPVSQSLLEGIGETLRQKMTLEETSTTVTQKVFSIFVELMQNVINYSAERGPVGAECIMCLSPIFISIDITLMQCGYKLFHR